MTCIVAVAHEGKIYMGGDSCGSDGFLWDNNQGGKVFRRKTTINEEDMLIGICGSFRMKDLLMYDLKVPVRDPKKEIHAYMVEDFIPALKTSFAEHGHLRVKDDLWEIPEGEFLIGFQGKLFLIQDDMSVINAPEYGISIGSGMYTALGALWVLRNHDDPAQRVLWALEAAGSMVTTVKGPYYHEVL